MSDWQWMVFWLAMTVAVVVLDVLSGLAILFAFFAGERWVMARPGVARRLRRRRLVSGKLLPPCPACGVGEHAGKSATGDELYDCGHVIRHTEVE